MAGSGDKFQGAERPILLRGENVSIGVILDIDLDFAFATINDPDVNRYLRFPGKIHGRGDEAKWIRNLYGSEDTAFANVENSSGDIVGFIGLHHVDMKN